MPVFDRKKLIITVADKTGQTTHAVRVTLDHIIHEIIEHIVDGDAVYISMFGKFVRQDKQTYRTNVGFRPSADFLRRVQRDSTTKPVVRAQIDARKHEEKED